MLEYINYHKHTHESNIRTIDCIVKPEDYINRALELGHKYYSTVEHGWAGNFLATYDLCKNNDIKMIYGTEAYVVEDRFQKDNLNAHIIIVAKNKEGFYQLNKIMSESNKTGFYYKNRVDIDLLSQLNPDLFFVTSACVGGIASEKINDKAILKFVIDHFKNNFYLEVQSNLDYKQYKHNEHVMEISKKYNIPIIHANDSHYIYSKDSYDRDLFLKGKGMKYSDEDGFILDYPNYNEIIERYSNQGCLTAEESKIALKNTMIFEQCEDLNFNKEIKMPTIYPNQDTKKIFIDVIKDKWSKEKIHIPQDKHKEYIKAIKDECEIVIKTNMQDYFLLNERIIDIAVNKYDGILTRTGRGSGVAFIINKLLGFTEIDRLDSEVPLYPTRFMSISRILETKSLPDIDFNTANPIPFIKASKDILGEDNTYYMVAFGKMKESEAFRNLCRAYKLDMNEYNEVGKNLDNYKNHEKWKDLIEDSKKFIGVIDSTSPSPCSFLLLNEPISEQLGVIRVGDELCACVDGLTSDKWKYLKNDFLTVSVWDIISKTFKLLNKPIPSVRELKKLLDEKVWKLYEDGITATLNQADSDFATPLVKKYSPQSVAEMSAWVAAIRPGFASLLERFLNREEYSTEVKELDDLLKDSFSYILYQEAIMKFLIWCGIAEEYTYDIIKKIAKKKFDENELQELKLTLKSNFTKKTNQPDKFDNIWQVIEDAVRYSFNASHALSVAWDSIYGAYLKANYPLEYYSVILEHYINNTKKTSKIIKELDYFNIKIQNIEFRKSIDKYTFDKNLNTIYKGIESIKFCNSKIALELYELRNNKYKNFIELLKDIKEKTSVDSRQLEILTTLNFFREFGKNRRLLEQIKIFEQFKFGNTKQIKKSELKKYNLTEELVRKYSDKETDKLFKELDIESIINELCKNIENMPLSIKEQLIKELECLDYLVTKIEQAKDCYFVKSFTVYSNVFKPYLILYNISNGEEIKTKITKERLFENNPFKLFNIIKVNKWREQKKWNKDEMEIVIDDWEIKI